jgi:hypothetical protein
MKRIIQIAFLLATLAPGGLLLAGDPCGCDTTQCCSFFQFAPAGGWHPDGGGVCHWWPKGCFPCCGSCDDYCRKPLPCICRPNYSHYYTFGPPEICYGCGCCGSGKGALVPVISAGKQ